ncbi:acetylglutamate kinase [Aquimarina sp. W85]|uniref:acetylglutamate kinase n=1 Tax=Aquimarina rhodophyticola TaxID=3342246 RepID=UPI00366F5A6F
MSEIINKETLFIAKIGGNVIEDPVVLSQFLQDFSNIQGPKILVHGGGKIATQLAEQLGIATEMIDGRRVTTAKMLDVIVMTYAGLVNTKIVSGLQKHRCNALGLSGADGNVITATKREPLFIDYGFAGDITDINSSFLEEILSLDMIPVLCSVTHDLTGQLLNTNADTIASQVAAAMTRYYDVSLFYCFELQGVLSDINDKESVIPHIDQKKYAELLDADVISDGMLPKLHTCFKALEQQVTTIHIADANFLKNPNSLHTTLTL